MEREPKTLTTGQNCWEIYGEEISKMIEIKPGLDFDSISITIPIEGNIRVKIARGLDTSSVDVCTVHKFRVENPERYSRFCEIFCLPDYSSRIRVLIAIGNASPRVEVTFRPRFKSEDVYPGGES